MSTLPATYPIHTYYRFMTDLRHMQGNNKASAKRWSFSLKYLLCLTSLCAASAFAQTGTGDLTGWQNSEPTGRLIIKYTTAEQPWQTPRGSKRIVRSEILKGQHLTLERKLSDTHELVKTGSSHNTSDELKAQANNLNLQSNIEYASVEYRRYPLLQPNDPLYQGTQSPGNQSYLYDGDYSVHAPGAWDITTGSPTSVIAIVDTGVLPDHPDIADRSVTNLGYDFVSADGPGDFYSANDGDGRDPNPTDPGDGCNGGSSSWHGTSVASVAAGNSNNSIGLTSIDWNARLLHARALGICGGTDADIIDAIRWSAGLSVTGIPDNPTPANVVNLSLGGLTECTKAWQEVIDELTERNVVFVMAAGNESRNALRSSPANCANVITVGSSTPDGDVDPRFSNFGVKVTTTTSGGNILVASNSGFDTSDPEGNNYRAETGTSFSAAIVSGAISLMHSLNPDLGPSDVRAILNQSATAYATGSNCDLYHCGGGVMNLSRALNTVQNNNFDPNRDLALELVQNQSTSIPLQREINANLFGFKDIRYFAIDVPRRGLLQAESDSSADLYGYLLNDKLSVIALDDDSGESTDFRVASLVNPGTYYVAVERERHRMFDGELAFSLSTSLSEDTPDSFEFAPVSAVASAVVESNTVIISGLQADSVLTISDGFYSLNNGVLNNTPVTVQNGDSIRVATQSPGSDNGSTTATVTVGAFSTSFTVTTTAAANHTGFAENETSSSGCSISSTAGASLDPLFLLLLCISGIALTRRSCLNRYQSEH